MEGKYGIRIPSSMLKSLNINENDLVTIKYVGIEKIDSKNLIE